MVYNKLSDCFVLKQEYILSFYTRYHFLFILDKALLCQLANRKKNNFVIYGGWLILCRLYDLAKQKDENKTYFVVF